MEIPTDLLYTRKHEWVRVSGNKGVVGVTDFAQEQLGDIVFVELPNIDAQVTQAKNFGVVESVKTVSDLYAPVSGKVAAVNVNLETSPELLNAEPYVKGWMIEIQFSAPDELKDLLSPEQYAELVKEEG